MSHGRRQQGRTSLMVPAANFHLRNWPDRLMLVVILGMQSGNYKHVADIGFWERGCNTQLRLQTVKAAAGITQEAQALNSYAASSSGSVGTGGAGPRGDRGRASEESAAQVPAHPCSDWQCPEQVWVGGTPAFSFGVGRSSVLGTRTCRRWQGSSCGERVVHSCGQRRVEETSLPTTLQHIGRPC